MKRVFKNSKGELINVVEYTLEILRKDPTVDIHIGTDSQNHGKDTVYAIVIAYHLGGSIDGGGRGVHYITSKVRIPIIRDKFTRLYKEAEYSIEVANWLTSQINVRVEIDMDYNNDQEHFSNKLVSSAKGWANSEGYKVNIKPHKQIATRAADYNCR